MQTGGQKKTRNERQGDPQHKPHTPEGHRRHTTVATVKSPHLVLAPEECHLWLHLVPHHSRSTPVLLATAAPHFEGQVLGSVSWLQTLWLATL